MSLKELKRAEVLGVAGGARPPKSQARVRGTRPTAWSPSQYANR
jgi:hypothetical protein